MSIRVTDRKTVALFDSVTGDAFGPTFEGEEQALDYLAYASEWTGRGNFGPVQFLSRERHHELHTRWFDERVDGDSGLLKSDLHAE